MDKRYTVYGFICGDEIWNTLYSFLYMITHSVTFDLDFFVIVSKNRNEMYQDEKKVHFVYTYICVELGR